MRKQNIAHPTDTRLYDKARRRLVALAQEADLSLRQSCARLAPHLAGQVGRHAHARQFKRMRKGLRRLKGYTGRVLRDIQRQLCAVTDLGLRVMIEAGLPDAPHRSPKGLRHGFGINATVNGIPLYMLQKWMGTPNSATR